MSSPGPDLDDAPADDPLASARQALTASRFGDGIDAARPVFYEAREQGHWQRAGDAALLLAKAHGGLKRHDETQRWAQEAQQSAHLAGDAETECAAWVMLATEHARTEAAGPAQHALDEAARLLAQVSRPLAIEQALLGLTAAYSELGFVLQAVHFARRALAVAETSGEPMRISSARATLLVIGGVACEALEKPDPTGLRALLDEMWPLLDRVRADAQRLGTVMALARVDRLAGCLHGCEGQLDDALAAYDRLVQVADQLPGALACSAWIERGLVQRRLGRAEEARASGAAAAACNPAPQAQRTVDIRRLALIADLQGDPQAALELMRTYHARRQYLSMSALDTRVAELSVNAEGQGLRVENRSLREQNASLTASVQQISQQAATDPLTGLLNRRGFEAAWALYAHGGRRRMLLLADLDHFKQINDRHSHAVGDAVLRKVAALMQQTLRGHDRLVRHGGEEFVALLLDVEPPAARAAIERLRRAIGAFDWSTVSPGLTVTLSGGLVAVGPTEGLEPTLERADKLLYAAKSSGRNRVLDDSTTV